MKTKEEVLESLFWDFDCTQSGRYDGPDMHDVYHLTREIVEDCSMVPNSASCGEVEWSSGLLTLNLSIDEDCKKASCTVINDEFQVLAEGRTEVDEESSESVARLKEWLEEYIETLSED